MVWRNELSLEGEGEKDNTHLGTPLFFSSCQMQLHIPGVFKAT